MVNSYSLIGAELLYSTQLFLLLNPMPTPLENWFLEQDEPNASCLLALRKFILDMDEHVLMAWKWGGPFFYYKGRVFCYLWIDKKSKEPYLAIYEGKLVKHPKLEWGDRKRITAMRIDPNTDLPVNDLEDILNQALNLYRSGVIKTKG